MKPSPVPLSAALLAGLLSACGGSDMLPDETPAVGAAHAQALSAADPVPPLLDDDGHPMPLATASATGQPLASRAQIEMLERGRADGVARVWVDAFGLETVHKAGAVVAQGPVAADSLGATTLVFVAAAEPGRAAAVVDRLHAQGLTQVWQWAP